jgi:hypothetical protein
MAALKVKTELLQLIQERGFSSFAQAIGAAHEK